MTCNTNFHSVLSTMLIVTIVISVSLPVTAYSHFAFAQNTKHQRVLRIGLVIPSFTDAAYNNKFYIFYKQNQVWGSPSAFSEPIHKNLNLLTSKLLPTGKTNETKLEVFLASHIKLLLPNANVELLTDADIDGGRANEFDSLIIFHQEYVTQQEYDNFKNFVATGGTLICMDGNIFYAEVSYNRTAQTVTLVKGHGWAFDGMNTAHREGTYNEIIERWANETSQWLGSNFDQMILGETQNGTKIYHHMTFVNNPFGYVHGEEQMITNPIDRILLNYQAVILNFNSQPIIATYDKGYGKGKVIVLGLYTDKILTNPKFLRFLDELFLIFKPINS